MDALPGLDQAARGRLQPSRHFMAAQIKRCRWLPCAAVDLSSEDQAAEGVPAVLALWSGDAQSHMLAVGDIVRQPATGEMLGFTDKLTVPHASGFTGLQAARLGDSVVVAAAGADGRVSILAMQLPNHPGATSADLQLPEPRADGGCLLAMPWAHKGPAASVDINAVTRSVLSVGQDGAIYIAPVEAAQQQQQQAREPFRRGAGFAGYSQGRWVDSNTFVTAGLIGGLQLWDARRGGAAPAASTPRAWGHAGCGAADAAAGAARQLLCLDVHRSRPNLCASGGSGGAVALWDLRMASAPVSAPGLGGGGDVWEVQFDPLEALGGGDAAGLPPLLFCTAGGELCRTAGGGKAAQWRGSGGVGEQAGGGGGLAAEVLLQEACSINSFDADPSRGDLMAVTDFEGLLFAARMQS
ncbi:MAG: hypothetical protein J3K34DRAFT_515984 [Monoraphidium minutum]|nr:MAG: hypothetical protein J3K34DRAFT_515984 [Monoraphidium minutum]